MSSLAPVSWRTSLRPVLIVALVTLTGFAVWFIFNTVPRYADFSPASWGKYYWPRRAGLAPHIAGGLLAISSGLVQVWLGLTGRTGRLHHVLGRVYGAGVLVGVAGGAYMALTIPPGSFGYASGLFMLSVAWFITTGMAIVAVRRGDFAQHRDWMLRSYTVTFAFVLFRLGADWIGPLQITADDDLDTFLAWGCWAVPLLLMEPLIQWRHLRPS